VLIIGSGNEPFLGAAERIFAGRYTGELELAILGGNSCPKIAGILYVSENNSGSQERMSVGFANYCSGDSIATGGLR
jgi:hypothetical protein